MSTLLAISSTQWFLLWVYLEMNTLLMCFLLSKDLSTYKMSFIVVAFYYCVQVFSSLLILMSVMKWTFLFNSSLLLIMGILMKLGVWPFHSWYLKLLDGLEMKFSSLWLLMTWQKLLPLYLIFFSGVTEKSVCFTFFVFMNLMFSLVLLKGSLNVKNVLGFSSMNNNSWILVLVSFSLLVWKLFFLVYCLSMIILMLFMSEEHKSKSSSFFILLFLLVNMSGLPPLSMFWAKVLTIKAMLILDLQVEVIFTLLMSTCYVIFFYLMMMLMSFFNISLKAS